MYFLRDSLLHSAAYLAMLAMFGVLAVALTLVGVAIKSAFFIKNVFVSYAVLFFLWGNVLIAHAVFLSPWFSSPEVAVIFAWLYVIVS
jgi:hypothetical protein